MDTLALIWLSAPYLAFASKAVVGVVQRFYHRRADRGLILLGALLIPYALVASPTLGTNLDAFANGLLAMAAYVFIPGALAIYRQNTRKPRPFDLADVLLILILWLPVEFDWLPPAAASVAGLGVPIGKMTGVVLALMIFLVIRPLSQVGYSFEFTLRDLRRAGWAALVFAAVGIPLGLIVGLLAWKPPPVLNADRMVLQLVGVYLLVALPEELLFRGVLQNLVEKRQPQKKRAALVIASVVFGAAHLDNPPAPNYPYALLATLAGLAYGWVWMRTRKITAAALTHTLIDWVWMAFFAG
jgi:membrane protease YdiL (CAAX protease family)